MSENKSGKTSLQSVQTCIHALQKFGNSLEDEKKCIIQAGTQLTVALQEDDAAWYTLKRLNDIILPDIVLAENKTGELINDLAEYAQMLIDTYNSMHNEG